MMMMNNELTTAFESWFLDEHPDGGEWAKTMCRFAWTAGFNYAMLRPSAIEQAKAEAAHEAFRDQVDSEKERLRNRPKVSLIKRIFPYELKGIEK